MVELSALRPINPLALKPMFKLRTVKDTAAFLKEMEEIPPSEPSMIRRILHIIQDESSKKDAVSYDVIRVLLTKEMKREVTKAEVADIVKGLVALVPHSIWAKKEMVALNSSVENVVKEIANALSDLEDDAAKAVKLDLAKVEDG